MFKFYSILVGNTCCSTSYLALDKFMSIVSSMRNPSSLKNRWFPLAMVPHFLEGFPPLTTLKFSVSEVSSSTVKKNGQTLPRCNIIFNQNNFILTPICHNYSMKHMDFSTPSKSSFRNSGFGTSETEQSGP